MVTKKLGLEAPSEDHISSAGPRGRYANSKSPASPILKSSPNRAKTVSAVKRPVNFVFVKMS